MQKVTKIPPMEPSLIRVQQDTSWARRQHAIYKEGEWVAFAKRGSTHLSRLKSDSMAGAVATDVMLTSESGTPTTSVYIKISMYILHKTYRVKPATAMQKLRLALSSKLSFDMPVSWTFAVTLCRGGGVGDGVCVAPVFHPDSQPSRYLLWPSTHDGNIWEAMEHIQGIMKVFVYHLGYYLTHPHAIGKCIIICVRSTWWLCCIKLLPILARPNIK